MLSALLSVVLYFNELMAANVGEVMSPATNFDSWIELYNPSDEDVSLGGMFLSNDIENLKLWQIPASLGSVPAKGFKVVWLGSNDIRSDQAPFKLDCDGGFIYLSDNGGTLIASQSYPIAISHTAYARTTDGGDEWGWTASPTPGASNATAAFASQRLDPPTVSQGSTLFSNAINVKVDIPEGCTLMYTTDGSLPMALQTDSDDSDEPSTPWTNWVKNGNCEGDDMSCLVGKSGDEGGELITHIVDGVGYNSSRGIMVHSIDSPQHEWDSQFFVYTPDHIWASGDRYHFSMKVRADKPSHITPQTQRTPGDYIHWQMLDGGYDVTTQWRTIEYEGTITPEQAGDGAMQTIAFHLNEKAEANNFYFDDIVWESYKDEGTSYVSSKKSKDGLFNLTSTTNLTVRLFKDGYLPSVPVTRSYIQTNNQYTLPIVSIVGDKKYFTDPKIGIDCDGTNGIPGNGQDSPRNYNQPWDRPVNFSYISPDGEMLFNQDVNIEVSGGWTRSQRFRSFKLKSNKVFDGQNKLDYTFFPQKPYIRNKTLLVRNGGNDIWTHNARFLDPALETIIQRSGIDIDVQSYVPVIEYVNGQLRGVLNLREPNNDKFAYANWGYDDEELDAFENLVMKNGNSDVINGIFELGRNINDDGAYDELSTLLDIDEFTNYMAATMFLDNRDWPNNNIKGYRSQKDGRYRFVSFDLDYAFNLINTNTGDDLFTYFASCASEGKLNKDIVQLLLNLLGHNEYRRKFIDTFCLMGGSVFEPDRASAIIDELLEKVQPMCQLMRQLGINDGTEPNRAAATITDRLNGRSKTMADLMKNCSYLKLGNVTPQKVNLSTDTPGAHILLNGIDVPYADFKGYLFQPVRLEAKAPAGYRFAGWKASSSTTAPTNKLIAIGDQWKYYDKGQTATGWQSVGFNDATWATGKAPLGYKMAVATTISYGSDASNKYPTAYFRKNVQIDGTPAADDVFQLNYQVDDGFVIYVNGQEAGSVNMPSGNIGFNTYTTTYAGDDPQKGTLNLQSSLFKSGTNIIAVEVHNISGTSSDFFWDCELLTTAGADNGNPSLTDPIIDLPTDATVSLTATFVPLDQSEMARQYITPVRINEVSANDGIYVNEYFKRNDWIELYNTTDEEIDVSGMYLTDNMDKPEKYQISGPNTIIPAHGYLIIWCDKLEPLSQLHASFKLGAGGDDLMLTAADGSWNDILTYPAHNADQTVGRFPDGSNNVYVMNIPTIAKANITSSYVTETEQPYRPDPGSLAAGDANGDGEVNILDVTAVISHLSGKTPTIFYTSAADIDRDGLVTAADLKLAVRIITGQ